ncbi:hypothetical protein C0Q58_30545 [Streptomyces albidoflavus]|nr:hypothetical protein C0Q58_30545 [Streptomyces albidoflavus]
MPVRAGASGITVSGTAMPCAVSAALTRSGMTGSSIVVSSGVSGGAAGRRGGGSPGISPGPPPSAPGR